MEKEQAYLRPKRAALGQVQDIEGVRVWLFLLCRRSGGTGQLEERVDSAQSRWGAERQLIQSGRHKQP